MLCRAVPLVPCWHRQMLLRSLFRCFLGLFRAFFFEFSLLFGLFNNFAELAFRELLILSSENLKHGDNSSHFTCFGVFNCDFISPDSPSASLVDLFGWVSVDIK